MNLARGLDCASEFCETIQALGYELWVPPTVGVELDILSQTGERNERQAAALALRSLIGQWRIQPFPMSFVQQAAAESFAEHLIKNRLLLDTEVNNGLKLAEVSLFGLSLLVSSDKRLLGIDRLELMLAFDEANLNHVGVASPRRLLKALR